MYTRGCLPEFLTCRERVSLTVSILTESTPTPHYLHPMNQSVHNRLISFIWSIADDCLRDVYVRGKYRDVILPMVVLRRLDALLEPTKEAEVEVI